LTAQKNAVHLPISDEGCPGKLTWCGTGKLVNAEVLAELKPMAKRRSKYAHCFHVYTGAPPFKDDPFSIYDMSCENTGNKRYICEIPE
jgi:hypothetical protein